MSEVAAVTDVEMDEAEIARRVKVANGLARTAYDLLPWSDPVGVVQWVHVDQVQANDYNPNAVAHHEMRLLHTSVWEDGYTQPVVAIWDPEVSKYIIVDGFHRWTVMRKFDDIFQRTRGYLPVVVLDKSPADRMASTIRHNRARGRHSIAGMGNLVFSMLSEGETDETICNKLGMEPEELARLKHITGYSKLYSDIDYGRPMITTAQVKAKAKYKKEHPDEHVPTNF